MSATCPAHLTLLYLITIIVFGKEYKLSETNRRITVSQNVFANYFTIFFKWSRAVTIESGGWKWNFYRNCREIEVRRAEIPVYSRPIFATKFSVQITRDASYIRRVAKGTEILFQEGSCSQRRNKLWKRTEHFHLSLCVVKWDCGTMAVTSPRR